MKEKLKAAAITLGCKVNFYDTEVMLKLLSDNGYSIVEHDEIAEIYIINTCTVTNTSDKKSRQMIRKLRNQNPHALVIACGCYAQTSPDELSEINGINLIIGTDNKKNILKYIENYFKDKTDRIYVNNDIETIYNEPGQTEQDYPDITEHTNLFSSKRTRLYVKIQDGCDNFCSYCIIPYARGPVRSRANSAIINEIVRLTSLTIINEIVLSGIHVSSFGTDNGESLIELIKEASLLETVERIRFSSWDPGIVNEAFVNELSRLNKICDHFHLSLQSGSNKILKAMNRKYTVEEYAGAIALLRKSFPRVAITTDIIVGFPGETDEDFEESFNFIKNIKLARLHVFPYSPKKGTVAARMPNQLTRQIKEERVHKMTELNETLSKEFINSFLGQRFEVLIEEQNGKNYEGYSTNYIKCIIHANDQLNIGEIHTVVVDYADGNKAYCHIDNV